MSSEKYILSKFIQFFKTSKFFRSAKNGKVANV